MVAIKTFSVLTMAAVFLSSAFYARAAEKAIQSVPIAGADAVSKISQTFDRFIQFGTDLNSSISSRIPSRQSFARAGQRFGGTVRASFRSVIYLILGFFLWAMKAASAAAFWVAGFFIILIQSGIEIFRNLL